MKRDDPESNHSDNLRSQAEERMRGSQSRPFDSKPTDGRDPMALVHELQVHQIELEMQNEELKRARLGTEDALAKYSDLYDFAPIGLFAVDLQGLIREVNLAGAALLGIERRNLMNRHFRLFVASEDLSCFDDFCKSAFGTSTKQTCELSLLRDGKPTVYARIEGIAADDDSLEGIECRIVVIDITERKRMENELRATQEHLDLKVQERTAELQKATEELKVVNEKLRSEIEVHEMTEKELLIAKVEAEESTRAKSAFLANMSHELRTPMNAVIGFSSLLLDDSLTPEQKDYIEGIRNGGESLLAIIDDILDYSRAEKAKIELESQPLSLTHLIDESLDLVATQASKKGLKLSRSLNYDAPDTIIGDHGRLRQILINLLSNAVKFTDKGGVSVLVSSKAVEGDKHQIFFEVKDTGIGIPSDKMIQLYQPFTQLERTLSCKRDGVGLGLAITKNLVELMGGTIWAESVPGQGTTFHFTIQAETIPGKHLDLGKLDREDTSESFPELKPMRILVAEDNPSNQRVLVEMLKRIGYRADAVANGREVIEALERQNYDLVLMDVKMPDMDGITATQLIRKLHPENVLKIAAITANALDGDREKCLEAGMDSYIAKPVKIEDLRAVLESCQ